jgi:hypothetical protein
MTTAGTDHKKLFIYLFLVSVFLMIFTLNLEIPIRKRSNLCNEVEKKRLSIVQSVVMWINKDNFSFHYHPNVNYRNNNSVC